LPHATPPSETDTDSAIAKDQPPCGICGEPIDYTLPHTDPRSYVVDHIIPMHVSHDDSIGNKQAAHRDCNRTKSANVPDGYEAPPRTFVTSLTW
jgi:5-methylcytosine-specific restriction endonuclease McrA